MAELTGSCLCGGVRFELMEPPVLASYCHCTRCQHRTGVNASAGGEVAPGSFRITAGEPLVTEWAPPHRLAYTWYPGREPEAVIDLGSAGSTLWVTRLGPEHARQLPTGERVHAYLAAGEIDVESVGPVATGDALRITGKADLRIAGRSPAELLVWTMS